MPLAAFDSRQLKRFTRTFEELFYAGEGGGESGGARIAVSDAAIWQRGPGGQWRIAVDISTPLPSR